METPQIGDKFKVTGKRGTYSFRSVQKKGDVEWWNFICVEDGKYHAFYPDEVRPATTKKTKRVAKKEGSLSWRVIPEGREPRKYIIEGKEVTFL